MVCMDVGIDHVADFHPARFRRPEVKLGYINWVAHRAQAFATSTEYVRSGDHRLGVQQLSEDHWVLLSIDLRPGSIPLANRRPCARQSATLASSRNAVRPRERSNRTASRAKTQYGP